MIIKQDAAEVDIYILRDDIFDYHDERLSLSPKARHTYWLCLPT